MHWTQPGAGAVLNLRMIRVNNDWDGYQPGLGLSFSLSSRRSQTINVAYYQVDLVALLLLLLIGLNAQYVAIHPVE